MVKDGVAYFIPEISCLEIIIKISFAYLFFINPF